MFHFWVDFIFLFFYSFFKYLKSRHLFLLSMYFIYIRSWIGFISNVWFNGLNKSYKFYIIFLV
jgi:hypothetical protein